MPPVCGVGLCQTTPGFEQLLLEGRYYVLVPAQPNDGHVPSREMGKNPADEHGTLPRARTSGSEKQVSGLHTVRASAGPPRACHRVE